MKSIKKTLIILFVLFIISMTVNGIHAENSTDITNDDVPVKTFTDLKNKINDANDTDTVRLTESYKFNSTIDKDLINGTIISKNLTIVGDNKSYIDGDYIARDLYIDINCSVTLKDLIFKNGYSINSGGAITVGANSTVNIINCTFLNNKVYNSDGGAISLQRGVTIEVNHCLFENNTSIRVSDLEWKQFKSGMGSAIRSTINSTVTLTDTVFRKNNAYLATVLVVSYNDVAYEPSKLYVKNCTFENNTSYSSGVIYLDELGSGELLDSKFLNNVVTDSGGTIILDASTSALVKNCLFEGNTAIKGGAIEIKVFDYDYRSNVSIVDCNFTKNTATEHGGAIYAKYGITKIDNCNFYDNYCVKGGAIYAKYASMQITNSHFDENTADYGGALFLRTEFNNIDSSIFNANKATQKGGAIYAKEQSTISSSDCQYVANVAAKGSDVYGLFIAQVTQTSSYFDDVEFTVKLSSPWKMPASQKVKLTLKGTKSYKSEWLKTDSDGVLTFKVPKTLNVGSYELTISLEDGVCYANPTINIVKAPTKIDLKKTTSAKLGKILKFHVINTKTNKKVANAKLNFKVYTGKQYVTYTLKSDENGLVTFSTDRTSAGKHTVKISSKNSNIKLSESKHKLTLKKGKAKVTAPKSAKKSSNIEITVKNKYSKNPIVKTNFNLKVYTKKTSKTYNVKTDSNGVLKLSVSKLTKGSHKMVLSLKNNNYNIKNKFTVKVK